MIRGKVIIDKKTKNLVKRIKAQQIAVIDHKDLDQVACKSLVEKQVKAVFNISESISGKYPNKGPSVLMNAEIPLVDFYGGNLFSALNDGDIVQYDGSNLYKNGYIIARGKQITIEDIRKKTNKANKNLEIELSKFIDNTLKYAHKEKNIIIDMTAPDIGIDFNGSHVLIVVRGVDYRDDLVAIKSYIQEMNPIIIAVDGGADACLENGYRPDIIIGDMDSVSDYALTKAKKILVHAYPDGRAPGISRVEKLGLDYILFPAPGTSEDIAMILAYDKGADLITAVGTHSNMIDFLEKGRPGMSSTLLVRLKLGNKLIDAKGVSKLYQSKIYSHYWLQVFAAIFLPLIFISSISPPIKQFIQLLALKIKLLF
ncbi:MAG: putative cytokinetic ring protein SteA [Halanaerobiaceae bacterium]